MPTLLGLINALWFAFIFIFTFIVWLILKSFFFFLYTVMKYQVFLSNRYSDSGSDWTSN